MSNPDYEKTYEDFWKEIITDERGNLDLEQIKKELYDYGNIIERVSIFYDKITGGRVSKPNTDPSIVAEYAEQALQEWYEIDTQNELEWTLSQVKDLQTHLEQSKATIKHLKNTLYNETCANCSIIGDEGKGKCDETKCAVYDIFINPTFLDISKKEVTDYKELSQFMFDYTYLKEKNNITPNLTYFKEDIKNALYILNEISNYVRGKLFVTPMGEYTVTLPLDLIDTYVKKAKEKGVSVSRLMEEQLRKVAVEHKTDKKTCNTCDYGLLGQGKHVTCQECESYSKWAQRKRRPMMRYGLGQPVQIKD